MWYEVLLGHDPWFIVPSRNGDAPLNAYGPLFNLFAGLSWLNPIAPKLLFGYGYVLFSVSRVKTLTASRPMSFLAMIVLTALFWNPFPWVEIAIRGHFDILVGLSCVWAIRAWVRGHDRLSGIWLALGVLLKFMPVVLLPFLALDRRRVRLRFLIVATAWIAIRHGAELVLVGAVDALTSEIGSDPEIDRSVDLLVHPRPLFPAALVRTLRQP